MTNSYATINERGLHFTPVGSSISPDKYIVTDDAGMEIGTMERPAGQYDSNWYLTIPCIGFSDWDQYRHDLAERAGIFYEKLRKEA